ncbi:uncharacterized protein LOC111340578 [Stylophora pistillata]|uniref:uncharacterized protein LOC111340578 n=1 Tax=Stylophora pistillata TaxID=50429 RepID=UPI000C04FD82|nr:uncharacterized protein LOC111340578 [Stylophora pistillata]
MFDLLENELPADFKRKYGLSWNLIKASLGKKPATEPIVEIKVNIKIAVVHWYDGTPKPMICIKRERSSPEVAPFQWLFTMGQASQPNASVIYNSLRYDDNTHVVTFHLREEDWNELNCSSTISVSSREFISLINCESVSFGNETVKSVKRIDPVETFGLSARQTFTVVESDEKCQVLKVIKMEENAHSYSGELEILDSSICKAKEMKISQPDKSPTGV